MNESAKLGIEIFVNVELEIILDISEKNEVLETKFDLTMKWSDFRITFKTLKENTCMNTLKQ